MIYGDNPQKINKRQDALGLTTYTTVPQLSAILQSGNLYVYCANNPVIYKDPGGFSVTKDTPPTENDGYVPPKGGAMQGKSTDGKKGWVDKNGNIWVPVPDGTPAAHGGGHWDVLRPDGKGYTNKYPGGRERPGAGKPPNLPKVPNRDATNAIVTGAVSAVGIYFLWTGIKWLAATLAAVPSGGGSLIIASLTP